MSSQSGSIPGIVARRRSAAARRREWTTTLTFFAFMAPLLIGLLVFTFLPIVWGFLVSLNDDRGRMDLGRWVGLTNYSTLLQDSAFRDSLKKVTLFAVFIVPTTFLCSLSLALLVDSVKRGRAFFRSVFFIPTACSYVVASLIWKMSLFSGVRFGFLNTILLNLPNWGPIHPITDTIAYTSTPPWHWVVLVTVRLWLQVGFFMIIFLAGLQDIPSHLYEAARVDGAETGWATFRYITFPLLRNTSIFVSIVLIINAFQAFDEFYNILSSIGSGSGNVTLARTPLLYLYNVAFVDQNYGLGSAGAFIVAALIIVFTLFQTRLFGLGRAD